MTTQSTTSPIRRTVEVPLGVEHAFTRFTREMGLWWPEEYTWSGTALEEIGIEPGVGGAAYERGPDGKPLIWGRVLAWEPPRRLVLTWLIGPDREPLSDPEQATEIEFRFDPLSASRTRVTLEHRGFERHGDHGASYQTALEAPEGWDRILQSYAHVDSY